MAVQPVEGLLDEYRALARNIAEQRERAERLRALADQTALQADAAGRSSVSATSPPASSG